MPNLIESPQANVSNRDPEIRNRFELGLIGQYGIIVIKDTNPVVVPSEFCRVHALSATIIDTLNGKVTGAGIETGGATIPLAAGDDITGIFTTIKLASGTVYICLSRELGS